ncbi:MAG: hypothetical protein E7624_04275 [Ruminococcaceae bacterium]|nr:hypothetical protein [Oscillospiraceae bacterium]
MKKFIRQAALLCLFFVCLLALSTFGVFAAEGSGEAVRAGSVQRIQAGNLASAVAAYRQSHPDAAQHKITANHKVVYADDAYFKDHVNATTSYFSYYAHTGGNQLRATLRSLGINCQMISDKTAASGPEILVGVVDRPAQSEFLPLVDVNEFGIMVTQNHIILLAWQDAALKVCLDTFTAYLGAGTLSLPVGFCAVGVANARWAVDFERPTGAGISLTAGQFVNDDSLQFLYTGAGVTRAAFLSYCTRLTDGGFTLVWQNTIGNNEFRMYQNTAKGIALYAAYNDFAYGAEFDALYQSNYGTADDHLERKFEKCIRLVSSPLSSVAVGGANIHTQQPYQKVTDSYMTTLGIASEQVGAGYVILLEDGRFVIIDGGYVSSKKNGVYPESKAIWDAMLALYKKAYGNSAVPTAQRPLHVAAWYLTHAHSDHYYAFLNMAEMIGADSAKKAVFKMDYVIANLPGEYSLFDNTSTKWGYGNSQAIHNMKSKVGNFTFLKVHAGQRIHFANLTIEVLMTYEDHLPFRIINTNDTCTVTRFHFQYSGASQNSTVTALSGEARTVTFLGDSWRLSGRYLCAMYGGYLKSDVSQIAHHGNIGCEKELYDAISPTAVLFNNELSSFRAYVWGSTTSTNPEKKHAYAVDRYVVRELTSVVYVWAAVAGSYITLHFTEAGPQYEAAFDLLTGKTVTYTDINKASSSQNGFAKRAHTHTYSAVWKYNAQKHWKECACGAQSAVAAHSYGAWEKHDAAQHKRACACENVEYAAHNWNSGTITVHPSHTTFGEKTFTCNDCGESYTEEIPKLTEHSYGAWEKYNKTQHKRACACEDVEYAAHDWNSGAITVHPSHTTLGEKTFTCNDCGESYTEEIPKLTAHEYGAWEKHSAIQHKRVCVCKDVEYAAHDWNSAITVYPSHTTLGEKAFTCNDCGESYTEEIPKLTEHSYGAWEKYNKAQHKRACACEDVEYAAHNWDNGVITVHPSHTTLGEKAFTCNDCGESYTEEIPKLTEHEYGAWEKYNKAQHKRACACEDVEYAAHNWDNGVITVHPSHTTLGEKAFTCNDCGESYTEEIPKLTEHSYGAWEKHDATQHKCVCVCEDVEYAAHNWNSAITVHPSHTTLGEKTFTCNDCGESYTEEIPKLTEHSYGAWEKHDATQHKRTCICEDMEYAAHNWDNGVITVHPSHTTLGEKTFTCNACGESYSEEIPKLTEHTYGAWEKYNKAQHKRACACEDVEYAAHDWNSAITVYPSHTTFGEKTFACDDCGESYTEEIPKLTEHEYGEWVIVKEAGVGVTGIREKSCACGHKVEESIPALQEDSAGATNPPNDSTPPADGEENLGAGAIVGIVVGTIGIGACLYWFVFRKIRRSRF